jgi:hypothetical protein
VSGALPWVKWFTKMVSEAKWRDVPADEYGCFAKMLQLGGLSSRRGVILGTDRQIAAVMGWDEALLSRTVKRLSAPPFKTVRRLKTGLVIGNFTDHHPPANFDPDKGYGHLKATDRPPIGDLSEHLTGEREGEREGEQRERDRVVAALLEVRGFPEDADTNADFVTKLQRDFPSVDLVALAGKFGAHVLDRPFKANASPRGQFRTWATNAAKWESQKRLSVVAPIETPEQQEARIRRGWTG